jgi:hypothetical protein
MSRRRDGATPACGTRAELLVLWCSSFDSSSTSSFAIDAEETKCDEFRHFTKFKYVELMDFFSFELVLPYISWVATVPFELITFTLKKLKNSEDSGKVMAPMYRYVRTVCHKMYIVSRYESEKNNQTQI